MRGSGNLFASRCPAFAKEENFMATESVNYQCLNCMGPLRFDGQTQQLTCDYCGSVFTTAQVEQAYAEKQQAADEKSKQDAEREENGTLTDFEKMAMPEGVSAAVTQEVVNEVAAKSRQAASPIDAYLERASWNDDERAGMRSYVCSSCAAHLTVDVTTAIEECPYCGNQAMVPGAFVDAAKPDLIVPFKLDKAAAQDALANYYKGKKFLPKEFASANRIAHVQGVYVPFWLYDGEASGSGTFEARNIRTWREGDYEVTKTDVYHVFRAGTTAFSRIPADGSAKMPDGHMDAIEPFDYSEMVPFSAAYLPGYSAERYDLDPGECAGRANTRMKNTLASQLRASVSGYSQIASENVSVQTTIEEAHQALSPVWMLHTCWQDEDYLFAMNGQTGRLVGDLPVSKPKVFAWFLALFVVVAALCALFCGGVLHVDVASSQMLLGSVVPALFVAAGVCYYFYSQMKTAREQTTAFDYVSGGGFHLTQKSDQFVNSFTTRRRVEKDDR